MALCSVVAVHGQDNMVIHFSAGSDVTIAINDIQRITFNGDNMLLKKSTGAENTYLLDNISCITFLDEPSIIQDNKDIAEKIEVNVYLNSSGELIVESSSEVRTLTLFDIQGRMVNSINRSSVNINSLSTGIYLLRVETSAGVVTKKFVKNR